MKVITTFLVLIIPIISCVNQEDRDHLIFKDELGKVEMHMQIIDSILPKLPAQKQAYKIQSYFYKAIEQDTILYINAIAVGSIAKATTESYFDSVFVDKNISKQFLKSSMFLARNNLTHCLNDYCGWVYVYKYSNDRDAYRPVIYNHQNKQKFMTDSCGLSLIDRKGNIFLFKEKY